MFKRAPKFLELFIVILSPLLLCVAVYIMIQPRIYQSTARFLLTPPATVKGYNPSFLDHEFTRMQSDEILGQTLAQLGLIEKYAKLKKRSTGDQRADAIRVARQRLQFHQPRGPSLSQVIAQSEDPKEAAALANRLLEIRAAASSNDSGAALVELVDRAEPSPRWVSPNVPLLSTLGLLLSALIAAVSAWVIRRRLSTHHRDSNAPNARPKDILPARSPS